MVREDVHVLQSPNFKDLFLSHLRRVTQDLTGLFNLLGNKHNSKKRFIKGEIRKIKFTYKKFQS